MATRHTFGEAEDLSMSEERSRWTRPQPVVRRACDDNANGVIQGGLVGSRVFCGDDDEHACACGRWSTMARSFGSARSGRGAITRCGKGEPMRCEESDGFVVVVKPG